MGDGSVRLVEPSGRVLPPGVELAQRLPTLAGTRLGVLDNGKANANLVLDAAVAELVSRYGVADVVRHRKTNPGMGASEQMLADFETCGAVLIGTAD